jgi:hypothetical protein
MGILGEINIDIGTILSGAGQLAKDIRAAITGKEPIDATKAAQIALAAQELENKLLIGEQQLENAKLSIALAEAQSQDKWTSRGRPSFLYVIYVMLLMSIPMGLVSAFRPDVATSVASGFGAWLNAIPDDLYLLFGAGYLGYTGVRGYEKSKGYQVTKVKV